MDTGKIVKFPGIKVYEVSGISGGIALPPFGIFVEKRAGLALKQHEYGHYLQYVELGFLKFYSSVGIPSFCNAIENLFEKRLYGKVAISVRHAYHKVETDANQRAQSFFGKNAAIQAWPDISQTTSSTFKWMDRLGIYYSIMLA